MRLATVSLVWAVTGGLVGLAGCSGDTPPGQTGGPDAGNPNGRTCGAILKTSGTFALDATAKPNPDGSGCFPYGTWTFTTSIESNDCTPPPVTQQYQFKVTQKLNEDGDPIKEYAYLTDPSARSIVKVSQGGGLLCEGELELFSADGKAVYLLKPELGTGPEITGSGEYTIYTTDQWPL